MSADRLLALAALALALVGVALALWVAIWMRRVRRAQSALLSGGPVSDLVEFAVGMQARQELVERRADELAVRVEQAGIEVAGALRRVGLQRFDAYDGAEGLQSTALALLDALGDGIVVSAIQDSDSARVYVKRVRAGAAADVALGPEELAAVAAARSGI
jgi:Trk K+ transport system NAD-binding subunit